METPDDPTLTEDLFFWNGILRAPNGGLAIVDGDVYSVSQDGTREPLRGCVSTVTVLRVREGLIRGYEVYELHVKGPATRIFPPPNPSPGNRFDRVG
jgi:hypothetical protein